MARANKTYGYTIALWEVPDTAPSLFLQTSIHKDDQRIPTTNMWRNMIDPSLAPYGLRHLIPAETLRDAHGDSWNLCHYWGNFEIADMDFFRGEPYRTYFERLDRAGGFYYERVRSLAGPVLSLHSGKLTQDQTASGAMRPSARSVQPSSWSRSSCTTLQTLATSTRHFSHARRTQLVSNCPTRLCWQSRGRLVSGAQNLKTVSGAGAGAIPSAGQIGQSVEICYGRAWNELRDPCWS